MALDEENRQTSALCWWKIVQLLMTPMPLVLNPHAPSWWRPFIQNFGCDKDWSVPVWQSCKSGQGFALREERATVQNYMPSVWSNITSDTLNFLLELLKEGATLALTKSTTLHSNVEHIDQEPRKTACLRLRSGVRFHMAFENECLTLM